MKIDLSGVISLMDCYDLMAVSVQGACEGSSERGMRNSGGLDGNVRQGCAAIICVCIIIIIIIILCAAIIIYVHLYLLH